MLLSSGFGLWDLVMNPSWGVIPPEQSGEVPMQAPEGPRDKRGASQDGMAQPRSGIGLTQPL